MQSSISYWTLRNRYSPPLPRPCHIEREATADAARLAGMSERATDQVAPEGQQASEDTQEKGDTEGLQQEGS